MKRSGKKRKSHLFGLIFLIAALILAAAFVLLLPKIEEWFPSSPESSTSSIIYYDTIDTRDAETLESITVEQLDGETYTLLYLDNSLALLGDDGETNLINDTFAEYLIQYSTEIAIEDTVAEDVSEVEENLDDMGLEPAQIVVTVTYQDGETYTISLGYGMTGSTYYYYRWSEDPGVYLCVSGVYEAFEYSSDMLFTVTQPEIDSSLVERLTIETQDGEEIVFSFSTDEDDNILGSLQSPYAYPMNADSTESLLSVLDNFRLGTKLEDVTDENISEYGFDNPTSIITIDQTEGLYSEDTDGVFSSTSIDSQSIELIIGNQDGDFFYYVACEDVCYRVSSFLISSFIDTDFTNYVTTTPADMGDATIQSIVLQTGSGSLSVRATYTEQVLPNNELNTDDNGDIIYDIVVTANGEEISTDTFDALVTRLQEMTISGDLDEVSEPDGSARWQLTITTVQGVTRTLSAYAMDSFHDILAVNGIALHYISNEALDIALGEMADYLEEAGTSSDDTSEEASDETSSDEASEDDAEDVSDDTSDEDSEEISRISISDIISENTVKHVKTKRAESSAIQICFQ